MLRLLQTPGDLKEFVRRMGKNEYVVAKERKGNPCAIIELKPQSVGLAGVPNRLYSCVQSGSAQAMTILRPLRYASLHRNRSYINTAQPQMLNTAPYFSQKPCRNATLNTLFQ